MKLNPIQIRMARHKYFYLLESRSKIALDLNVSIYAILKATMLIASCFFISGCACAPNSWNATVPTGFNGSAVQGIWVGVSGPLPWVKP